LIEKNPVECKPAFFDLKKNQDFVALEKLVRTHPGNFAPESEVFLI
jgi:hypothetical protein